MVTCKSLIIPFLLLGGGAAFGITVNQDAPSWSGVMLTSQEVNYFKYLNTSGGSEIATSSSPIGGSSSSAALSSTARPDYTYRFSAISTSTNGNGSYEYGSGTPLRSVCNLSAQGQNLGDYTVSGSAYSNPTYAHSYPAEFNESRLETGIKGIDVLASFDGNLLSGATGHAVETVYFSDQGCAFGGHEYGFTKDLDTGVLFFYYADHSNCGTGGANCNASDSVTDTRSEPSPIEGLQLNSQGNMRFYFAAYLVSSTNTAIAPHGYFFRIQVVDPYTFGFAQCYAPGTTTVGDCTRDLTMDSWFHADNVYGASGYLFSGIVATENPDTVGNNPDLYVNLFDVGK